MSGIISAIIIPFVAPFALDFLACITIYLMNKKKGHPTWKKGTRFAKVAWPSGFTVVNVYIENVTFRTVTLRTNDSFTIVKKRDMLKTVAFQTLY
jgi:ATP sulfurylase